MENPSRQLYALSEQTERLTTFIITIHFNSVHANYGVAAGST